MGEPAENVIDIDSEDEHRCEAEAAAAAAALAAQVPQRSFVCQLTLPPSRGIALPQVVGQVQVWRQDTALHFFVILDEQEGDDEEMDLIVPLAGISAVDVQAEGPTVTLTLSPPLAPTGFAVDFMAEGHRISMVSLAPAPQDLQVVLATLMYWLQHLTLHGPRSLGLMPRSMKEPFALRFQGTVLEERDVDLLEDEQWFNDTIMDFFLRLAIEVAAPSRLQEEVYVAKTQFFTRLTASGASSGEKGWENVKTWTRTVTGGVANQRVLVYPVNEANLHWCVFFVCHPYMVMGKEVPEYEEDTPRIVCLDSAWEPVPKDDHIKLLKGYLRRELYNNSCNGSQHSPSNIARWKAAVVGLEKMAAIDADVPKQQNVYDCGLYVLEFLLFLLRQPDQFSTLGLTSHQAWFDQSIITHRRVQMRELVSSLLTEGRRREQTDVAILLKDEGLRARVREALTSEPPPPVEENVSGWTQGWNQGWNAQGWKGWNSHWSGDYRRA